METADSLFAEPADTREAIMQATFRALCEHGYAGLTISRIAQYFPKSKSLLYHHYESKEELLLDFLAFMLERYQEAVPKAETDSPEERLAAVLDASLSRKADGPDLEFLRAMTELRAQAAHDERFREHFRTHDRVFRETLVDIVEDGIESGVFREVDAEQVAAFVFAGLAGGMTQLATAESGPERDVLAELRWYVDHRLLAEDAGE
ncbi:MAG: TetR/AcrR family transcriptional regulator [Halodesulfurarchaeum sp.]